MSRYDEPAIGKLIHLDGREVEITRLAIDKQGGWWAGMALLAWGSIASAGLHRIVLNDGRAADVIVDSFSGDGTGRESVVYVGYGPPPDWPEFARGSDSTR